MPDEVRSTGRARARWPAMTLQQNIKTDRAGRGTTGTCTDNSLRCQNVAAHPLADRREARHVVRTTLY